MDIEKPTPTPTVPEEVSDDAASAHEVMSELGGAETVQTVQTGGSRSADDRNVRRSKTVAFLILGLAAVGLGFMTFFLTRKGEVEEFEDQFKDFASELVHISDGKIKVSVDALKNAAITTTSLALISQQTWPQVTIPHFAERSQGLREIVGSPLLVFSPMVYNDRTAWETYSIANQGWTEQGHQFQNSFVPYSPIPAQIHNDLIGGAPLDPISATPFSPVWQMSPVPEDVTVVNFDLLLNERFLRLEKYVDAYGIPAISDVFTMSDLFGTSVPVTDKAPRSILLQPIFQEFGEAAISTVVGHYIAVIEWDNYFKNILHQGVDGVVVVLKSSCGQANTFVVDGPQVTFVGQGDRHDREYDDLRMSSELFDPAGAIRNQEDNHCFFTVDVYPSDSLKDNYISSEPIMYAAIVLAIMMGTALAFYLYETLVQQRQQKVLAKVARTNAIVSSLFPENVRDRLLHDDDPKASELKRSGKVVMHGKQGLKNFLEESKDGGEVDTTGESKPIADLFPHTTVMFADISGFTAWSSVREPAQVFTLLETIYQNFDKIAKQRRVFKVETVGDCYVAVAGLPEPRKDHAVVMALFARDCMKKMQELVRQLEVTLGPDTGDLANRFGLHSGPCTAGVLRGERARFQLFGDTVNTAARMESTGLRNKIHISQETADLLREAGKGRWVEERKDVVVAKGKGALQTYWLNPTDDVPETEESADKVAEAAPEAAPVIEEKKVAAPVINQKSQRLIDWNCELLLQNLRKVVARRETESRRVSVNQSRKTQVELLENKLCTPGNAINEIEEIIRLPKFEANKETVVDPKSIDLGDDVKAQTRDFVAILASLYRDNEFHCFEHASHVTMSVSKLLSRIVAPDVPENPDAEDMESALHDYTYGITSDPLTHFAVILSALIHDVDHRGVPNFVLSKEDPNLAKVYQNKSIAEQNSIDLAWNALMDPSFEALRQCIYSNEAELQRFRKLLVNSVLATDIFDKELSALRKNRWNKAFSNEIEESKTDDRDRKATIVIEHLIQASDVSHTMQHWHIYRKWNKRLFLEMKNAFDSGRTEKDPVDGWYLGELGFFDNYIIPLAKKLKDCGVFGVSSDEYLGYATQNRREWEKKGSEIVAQWKEELQAKEQENA